MEGMDMKVSYTLKETFKNLWRNRLMSIASVTSVVAALIILGIIFILVLNINNISEGAKDQFTDIEVYLDNGLSGDETIQIGDGIESLQGVKFVNYKSKESALEEYKVEWGEDGYLLDGFVENPLPNSYVITLTEIEFADYVVNTINELNGVEEVRYDKDFISKIISVSDYVKTIGLVLILILIAISTFIINNTIKIVLNSRKVEISIMKYVGATNWFIRWPFILEGTILGFAGACIATAIMYFLYNYTYTILTSDFYSLIAVYLVGVKKVLNDSMVLFVTIGCGIGALGSITSIRKHLDV
jgi:cell division transport system permease protein